MTITEVFKNQKDLLNSSLVIEGKLIIKFDESFLVDEDDNPAFSQEKILVIQNNLLDRCLEKVPCWVGGEYYYNDKVKISGELTLTNHGSNRLGLTKIKDIIFYRGANVYDVSL